ncbi:MAG: hypothetical protein ACYC7J_17555 [Syntrophales bacterium]
MMARSRILKPEFWSDEKLALVPREARLTFAGLWTCSDDYGVTKGHPAWLKAQIFPYDTDLTLTEFQQWLTDLERIGVIDPFTADGESFFFIRNFADHQKVDRPSKMRNPPCPRAVLARPSRVFREPLATDSRECSDETETETETETEIQTTTAAADDDRPPLMEGEQGDEADLPNPDAGRRQPKPAARVSSPAEEDPRAEPPDLPLPEMGGCRPGPQAGAASPKRKGVVFDYDAGRFDQVPPDLVEKWQQAYPAVDVFSELRRMEAWASANPVNRKSNWQRFIVNWLTRAQDRAGRGGPRTGLPEGEGGLDRWLKKSSTHS